MAITETALSVAAFIAFFVMVEYATYRVMERKHEKQSIYRLFFMAAWTTLALVHMWVVAPLLNLPPTSVVGLGFGILGIHIAADLNLPVFRTIGVIGLYPFALVYELFVVLLVLAEGVTLAASLTSPSQLSPFLNVIPSDPQIHAALGLGFAASVVAVLYYDPQGENGYHYAGGHDVPASVDYEKFRQIKESEQTEHLDTDDPSNGEAGTSDSHGPDVEGRSRSESSRALASVPNVEEYQYNWTRSNVGFDDIGGYYEVKQRLAEEVIQPVRAAAQGDDRYDRFGIEPARGILLYGPPGTGKTLFARALAGELDIPFVELSPADVTSKWINEGPQRVRQLFEEAAAIGPCVIFLDEAEHLFGGRDVGSGGAHAEDRKITSELLVHLTADDRTAIVVGATNRPDDIDPAILRPGRLTNHFEIGLPDEESRHAILQSKVSAVPSSLSADKLADLAAHTRGFSGADLETLVDDAKRAAAKRDADAVTIEDFPSLAELDALVGDIDTDRNTGRPPDPSDSSALTSEERATTDDESPAGY